jgi:DnaJ-class molecular chaperone
MNPGQAPNKPLCIDCHSTLDGFPCNKDASTCDKCGGSGEIQDNSKAALKKEAAEPGEDWMIKKFNEVK